jgi:hypothetical protein
MEVIMHTVMIRMFRLNHFYSPGLATAVFVLLPISLHVHLRDPTRSHAPDLVVVSFLYMLFGLVVAQQLAAPARVID